jgi:hypothetical protein
MDTFLHPHPNRSYSEPTVPPLLFQLHDDDPQLARVATTQQLLLPATPRAICDELGLNFWAALKLHEDEFLSFSPESTRRLDEAQEAELRFLASLVLAGCDRTLLTVLLAGLPKPYAYDLRRLYYDWSARRWRTLPDPNSHPETVFTDWIETLVHKRDVGSLVGIGELARDALARVEGPISQSEFSTTTWSASSA